MNSSTPDDDPDDGSLRTLLQEAHPSPSLPPRFQEGVWKRLAHIEARSRTTAQTGWFEQFVAGLLRPAYASIGLASLMLLGTWLGVRNGEHLTHQTEQIRYLAAVSPFHRPAR